MTHSWVGPVPHSWVPPATYEWVTSLPELSGRLREAVNEHARVSFRYNSLGLPVEERCDGHLIERSYDKHGLIVSLRSSLGAQLSYERNAYGELVCFRADEAETNARFTSEHQYDSLGFELERLLPRGVSQSFAYDNIGRLVDSKTRRSAEQRRSRHYRWGSADRLLSIEDDRYGLTQYSYSSSGELTMATYADGRKEYRFSDKVGNLYNDPDKKLRKYLEGGRIEKSGEWTFKYDKDGQLIEKFRGNAGFFGTKKDRWKYCWTQNGMLEGVRSPHRYGQWTRFTYDALGRRLTKLGDATSHYLWNGNVPLHEWRTGERYEDGGLKSYSEDLKTWLFEEESFVPLALIQDGKSYSVVCDQLGTPTEAYDEEGREVWYRRLDMNGKILEETQPGLNPEGYVSIPFLFQGQYYDHETGLAYNRFRYYDPELGRYISEDPIRLAGGVALFGYVEDVNSWLDILGLRAGNISFLPQVLHPETVSASNPGGTFTVPASGNYHDDKVALYAKAGISESFSPDYIAHHVSYDKETNTMEVQLVHKESHKAVSHKGGVKDYEDQTGQKYKRNSYAK